ncbi:hypothetical protein OE699_01860 [Sedimentimonas flavescens]|uniref:Uncharacterized protein n=1 Tax=Sedimentimonas flavescens TaxID=2851012 RepID=A0ABT2ZVN7_9RHOB|nr:hypothetical protein [Sedimentimonas flavescens]MCV2877584.1 hypothetical protein [Sedimentimonas flavescens]
MTHQSIALAQARALVADPVAATAAGFTARTLAWAALKSQRGHTCRWLRQQVSTLDAPYLGPEDAA